MPDLDQLLDTLVADVAAGTRAPGAPEAVKQARRRRAAVVSAGAVAVLAVGGGLAIGTLGGPDRPAPIGEPATPSPEPTTVQEGAGPTPTFPAAELNAILTQDAGWAVGTADTDDDYDYAFNGPCSGRWSDEAVSGADGGLFGSYKESMYVAHGHAGFRSSTQASEAAARLVENLESCDRTVWRTQPIAQTGAVLAWSSEAAVWIQVIGEGVEVTQLPTSDGRPPASVQVEVAEWMATYVAERETDEHTDP